MLPSCARVAVEPIEVKPIHITMDEHQGARELDQFFAFEDKLLAGGTARLSARPPPNRP